MSELYLKADTIEQVKKDAANKKVDQMLLVIDTFESTLHENLRAKGHHRDTPMSAIPDNIFMLFNTIKDHIEHLYEK